MIRIVKLTIKEDKIKDFLIIFEHNKSKINQYTKNNTLDLHKEINSNNIFFTVSHWQSEDQLKLYKESELFNNIWKEVKPMFKEKALAWSIEKL